MSGVKCGGSAQNAVSWIRVGVKRREDGFRVEEGLKFNTLMRHII